MMKSQQDDLYFNPFTIGFETVESKTTGLEAVRLTDEPYKGIIFQYGKVSFTPDEENDKLHLKFEYDILDQNNKIFKEEIFEKYIGDLLQQLIMQGVAENSLTYTGGTDEN
jgi:nicotinamide mononucleotide (NMN) deamidase PncC